MGHTRRRLHENVVAIILLIAAVIGAKRLRDAITSGEMEAGLLGTLYSDVNVPEFKIAVAFTALVIAVVGLSGLGILLGFIWR